MTQTDDKKPEVKKSEPKEKVNFHHLLKEKRVLLTALRKDIDTKRAIRESEHNEKLRAILSERKKAVAKLEEEAGKSKESHKLVYDQAKAVALKAYDDALATITKAREEALAQAHARKQTEYDEINTGLREASAPFIEKHREESKALIEKYHNDEEQHSKACAEAVKNLQEEIAELEGEIAKRAERHQAQKEAKPAAAPTT